MKKIIFLFGIHNHQPVGNFAHVFRDAFQKCYHPFIKILKQHPGVRLSLHYSGPLLEWIEKNQPAFLADIKMLVDRGQVELMGGGFYEPILTVIPRRDAIGQITMMSSYLAERFNKTPRGMWLAERIWEPHLPSIINEAAIKYTLLDDTHFLYAGITQKDIFGYYITEDNGQELCVFPIDRKMRYLVPFRPPEETIAYLREQASEGNTPAVVLGDDGEKFGVWPGTHTWVYEDGYLERFFSLLEKNASWIEMQTFSEFIERVKPLGRIYLPTASYEEMMEWALPVETGIRYDDMVSHLTAKGLYQEYRSFLRGGFWRNFLVKYPEGNLLHKKMLHVSEMVSRHASGDAAIRKELWKGQCNCAYWHGLFGGLYLNYLRHAAYTHLLCAEVMCDRRRYGRKNWFSVETMDYNKDGALEVLMSSRAINLYVTPEEGGTVFELDYKPRLFNLSNTLSRKKEAYHRKLAQVGQDTQASTAPRSIHDVVKLKEKGLEERLFYDRYPRYSFVDHFFREGTTMEDLLKGMSADIGDFAGMPYTLLDSSCNRSHARLSLERKGNVRAGKRPHCVTLRKDLTLSTRGVAGEYRITAAGAAECSVCFGIEFNLTLLAGNDRKRYYTIQGERKRRDSLISAGIQKSTNGIEMVDRWNKFLIKLSWSPPAALWRFPVETISQSENGFERNYQGSVLIPTWKLKLSKRNTVVLALKVEVEDIKKTG